MLTTKPQTGKDCVSVDTVFNILLKILFFIAVCDLSPCTGLTHSRVCRSNRTRAKLRSQWFSLTGLSSLFTTLQHAVYKTLFCII